MEYRQAPAQQMPYLKSLNSDEELVDVKRMLFVSAFYPRDFERATHGVYMRMRLLLEAVQRVTETADVLFFIPSDEDDGRRACAATEAALLRHWKIRARVMLCKSANVQRGRPWWRRIGSLTDISNQSEYSGQSGDAQIQALSQVLQERPHAVVVHRLSSMVPFLMLKQVDVPIFFDLDDIEHRKRLRQLTQPPVWIGKMVRFLEVPALYRAEKAAARRATETFVCSDLDQKYLSRRGFSNITVVPNAVRIPAATPLPMQKVMLFLGSYTYAPNVSAANLLINVIWPKIRSCVPDASLIVAGARPERLEAFTHPPAGVEFPGFVEDLDALYSRSMLVCCPILYGGGTRIKIIEAAAYGRPIVSTTVGAEGIGLKPGESIELEDDPVAFAAACVDLLDNRAQCKRLGHAARRYALAHFDQERIVTSAASSLSRV